MLDTEYRSNLDWQLGKGGFGTVYAGVHQPYTGSGSDYSSTSSISKEDGGSTRETPPLQVAIKLERADHEKPCLANEARALKAVQGAEGIPTPYGDAAYSMMVRQQQTPYRDLIDTVSERLVERYNALVIERLGEDLGTLFRRHLFKQLRPSAVRGSGLKRSHSVTPRKGDTTPAGWDEETIAWLGCHALKRLEWVHSKGLVHRDIHNQITILPFDDSFGMAQSYRTAGGQHMPHSKELKSCVGTQAVMSYRCQGTRRDDVESLGYMLMFLYQGSLPWSKHADRFEESFARSGHRWTVESVNLNDQIRKEKKALIKYGKGLDRSPREIQAFFEHVSSLQFADKPDYAALRAILRRMRKQGVSKSVDLGFERSCARVRKEDIKAGQVVM
ncbi:hypothetical protein QFC20_005102 [Naganishia adeliensis]|uniref:Uncharacterized protein n=1 Tax=Naganishia adeliensis TaxID=92952 RepID=A0ACC2VSJ0_9TREE|nr:hypothetical protein QFC20_005102 [Naganishia adeliensis]